MRSEGASRTASRLAASGTRYAARPTNHHAGGCVLAALILDQTALSAYRLAVTHLDRRLPGDEYPAAAFGGLQDTVPRAGLFSLHARLEGVGPDSWEHPLLVQVWFRWADYLVPRRDVGVFTLGASPRDPDRRAALERAADAVVAALDGRALLYRELEAAGPGLADLRQLRDLAVTGKVHIRWDASKVWVIPASPAAIDEEDARRQLLRRFLHWLGPATPAQFARWARVNRSDAAATWQAERSDLVPVGRDAEGGWVLAEDEPGLRSPAAPAEGSVRFLPLGDPYLYPHGGLRLPAVPEEVNDRLRRAGATARLINSLAGRLLVGGAIAGSWGRSANAVTLAPWRRFSDQDRESIRAELKGMGGPLGRPVRVNWIE